MAQDQSDTARETFETTSVFLAVSINYQAGDGADTEMGLQLGLTPSEEDELREAMALATPPWRNKQKTLRLLLARLFTREFEDEAEDVAGEQAPELGGYGLSPQQRDDSARLLDSIPDLFDDSRDDE